MQALLNEDSISYYLLGAFMTDGNLYRRKGKQFTTQCELASKDSDWIEKISAILGNEPKIRYNKSCTKLLIYNYDVFKWFEERGCTERKSLTLILPTVPQVYLPDFIRGCMDGDGSISKCKYTKIKNKKSYTYDKVTAYLCGGSFAFLSALSQVLVRYGYSCKVHEVSKRISNIDGRLVVAKNPHYRITLNGAKAIDFLKWIYYPDHKLSMPRKYAKFLSL